MSTGNATFFGDTALADWVKLLLWILNLFTTIITLFNLYYLKTTFPKVKDIPSKQSIEDSISIMSHKLMDSNFEDIMDMTHSLDISEAHSERRTRLDSFMHRQSRNRSEIQKYFYVVSIIPCCVSYAGHYGARFPEDASWIFPGMNIAIGIGFLAFIRMMVKSCEGWHQIRKELIQNADECDSCKARPMYGKCCRRCCCKPCFLKENAYEGLKQRILICCLILVKPVINYIEVIFEIDYHSTTKDQRIISYTLRSLTMFTTFIPLNVMRSFHATLLPYTRVRRTAIKRTLVAFLAPVCQIQEVCVQFIWAHWNIAGFDGIEDKYRWCCAYGMILVVEMTIVSCLITFVAYRPKDLRLWEYSESFLRKHGYKNTMTDEDFLFGDAGIIDNIEEPLPNRTYNSDLSMNQSMESRISNNPSTNGNPSRLISDLRTRSVKNNKSEPFVVK
eukprot:45625_1